WRAQTRSEGRFEILAIDPDDLAYVVEIAAQAKGYIPATVAARPLASGSGISDVQIRLQRGGVVRGRVLQRDGRPPDELEELWLYRRHGTPDPVALVDFVQVVLTEGDGSFEFDAVPCCDDAILELEDVLPPRLVEHVAASFDAPPIELTLDPT